MTTQPEIELKQVCIGETDFYPLYYIVDDDDIASYDDVVLMSEEEYQEVEKVMLDFYRIQEKMESRINALNGNKTK